MGPPLWPLLQMLLVAEQRMLWQGTGGAPQGHHGGQLCWLLHLQCMSARDRKPVMFRLPKELLEAGLQQLYFPVSSSFPTIVVQIFGIPCGWTSVHWGVMLRKVETGLLLYSAAARAVSGADASTTTWGAQHRESGFLINRELLEIVLLGIQL